MDPHHPDFLPQWASRSEADGRPRGLLDELIETGILAKELVMPDGTYRVQTRIHCDERTCLFRCSVSRDGAELQEAPWQPIFQNLDAEFAGRGEEPQTRREVARRALEAHLGLYTRVGQALERHGHLVRPAGRQRQAVLIGTAILVGIGLVVGGWFLVGKGSGDVNGNDAPSTAETEVPLSPETLLAALAAAAEEAGKGPGIASAAEDDPAKGALEEEVASHDRPATAVSPRDRGKTGLEAGKPSPPTHTAVPQPPKADPPPPPPPASQPRTRSNEDWPVVDVQPSSYSSFKLEEGRQIYNGARVVLTEVPVSARGLRCVTTHSGNGDDQEEIALTLTEPARLLIVHDSGVKNPPDWLGAFRKSGERIRARDGAKPNDLRSFDVFERALPAGRVILGLNTGASGLGRLGKRLAGRGSLMYLVCIDSRRSGGKSR